MLRSREPKVVSFLSNSLPGSTRTRRGRLETLRLSWRFARHPHILDIVGMDASIIRDQQSGRHVRLHRGGISRRQCFHSTTLSSTQKVHRTLGKCEIIWDPKLDDYQRLFLRECNTSIDKRDASRANSRSNSRTGSRIGKGLCPGTQKASTPVPIDGYSSACPSYESDDQAKRPPTQVKPRSPTPAGPAGEDSMTKLAGQFLGAMTQAITSRTPGNGDTPMRHLAARQSSINTKLPMFSGRAEEWPAFINLYRSSTNQCGFSDAENVQRLQVALKGQAKDAVQLILAVPENVEEAIRALERRFGRPELVVDELIGKARAFRQVKADDTDGLLAFSTAVSNVVTTMKLMKSPGHMLNPTLRREADRQATRYAEAAVGRTPKYQQPGSRLSES